MVGQGSVPPSWRQDWNEPFRFTPDANPYVGHRLTVEDGDRWACDCGESFGHLVDLERHQQGYRHPGISSGWDPGEESHVNGAEWVDSIMRDRQ